MEITSRPVSTAGTPTTTSERPSGITTKTTATCGRDTIWALCTTLVEQSSWAACYLRDEALNKKKWFHFFFSFPVFSFLILSSVDNKSNSPILLIHVNLVEWSVVLVNPVSDFDCHLYGIHCHQSLQMSTPVQRSVRICTAILQDLWYFVIGVVIGNLHFRVVGQPIGWTKRVFRKTVGTVCLSGGLVGKNVRDQREWSMGGPTQQWMYRFATP